MRKIFLIFFLVSQSIPIFSQSLLQIELDSEAYLVQRFISNERKVYLPSASIPLFTYEINNKKVSSAADNKQIRIIYKIESGFAPGFKATVEFQNNSNDTVQLSNVVPFGALENQVHITGKGDHWLSRTHLFIPGSLPVNVICPDNAWELGFSVVPLNDSTNTCGLMRRDRASIKNGQRRRFETVLYPKGSVVYNFYADFFKGPWQEGLRLMFQERFLYDLPSFNNYLFERKDLQWIRHSYVMHLMQAWNKSFYDSKDKKYHINEFIKRGKKLYGGDEVIGIWPTWPSLGLDQRNQFDLFRDLPGGTNQIRKLGDEMRKQGTKLFICYNPWDESTRSEGHLAGLGDLIGAVSADGVVLDTRGESSKELQEAADKARVGVVMYSEGMAVPKDMPGIVSGRVHNALYYVPMLNLNKFIKPEFAIFRVAELYKEPIQREFAVSFFNGYGTEMNIFAPGEPDWAEKQYQYLGRTSRILRENSFNFTSKDYTPLVPTSNDQIWVNKWTFGDKTIFTIYSIIPEGFKDYLFEAKPAEGFHYVDLWHHKLLEPEFFDSKWWIEAETNTFDKKWLGTNNEAEVDCIARLPLIISAKLNGDELELSSIKGDRIRIWAGRPDYSKQPLELKPGKHKIRLTEQFGRFEGDFIIQSMQDGILLDETIVSIKPGTFRRISSSPTYNQSTSKSSTPPAGMVLIPKGKFKFNESHGDEFIPYPTQDVDSVFNMPAYFMDRHPVTNGQFLQFLNATKYKPSDQGNFLKHWINGKIPKGMENYPVVYVSYEDAKTYSKWAGKRLPTEIEWQYAAQTEALNEWPWKQTTPVTRKEEVITESLTVTSIEGIDPDFCNLGDGKLYPVGKYPKGANPNGLQDLVGCVWQLTNDEYINGSYRYIILKGGSYFKPSSSWWYVQSGPRELHYRQFLLRVSQGFERNGTVGFRCVYPPTP